MKRVLIVENNEDIRGYLALVASKAGYSSVSATTVHEAEGLLHDPPFDFTFVSDTACGQDFPKAIQSMVKGIGGGHVVVICHENYEAVSAAATASGAAACLTTPFELVFVADILCDANEASDLDNFATVEG